MEGIVYVQSSTFNWKYSERYLVLNGSQLLVYRKKSDPTPKRHAVLYSTCVVSQSRGPDSRFHEFCITFGHESRLSITSANSNSTTSSHQGTKAIRFATKSREESLRWARAIEEQLQRLRYDQTEKAKHHRPSAKGLEHTPAQIQSLLYKTKRNTNSALADFDGSQTSIPDIVNGGGYNSDTDDDHEIGDLWQHGEWEQVDSESGIAVYRQVGTKSMKTMVTRHAREYNRLLGRCFMIFGICFVLGPILLPYIDVYGIGKLSNFIVLLLTSLVACAVYMKANFHRLLFDTTTAHYMASVVVRGSPDTVFRALSTPGETHWMLPFPDGEELEKVNEFSSICYHQTSPVWMSLAFGRPRDMVVLRYWRQEEDGSYYVIFQSTSHSRAPPRKGFVRASVPLSAIVIYPQRIEVQGRGLHHSMVTLLLAYEPGGFAATWCRYMNSMAFIKPVMFSLVGLRDAMAQRDFIDPQLTVEPRGPVVHAVGVDDQGLVVGVKTYPCSCPTKYWAEPAASRFVVRGPSYLRDRVKVLADKSAFHLVAVDMLSFEDPSQRYNIGSRPDGLIAQLERDDSPTSPMPFTFIVNMVIPCSLNLAAVCYYQPSDPDWKLKNTPFTRLLTRFMDGDDEFRNSRFKLIPTIVDGSFILRKALGTKPALIGNKGLRIPYHRGRNWFEVDIDVDSDTQARNITGMVIGATKSLVVDIAFLIESQSEEELPETILGTVRFKRVDTSVCKRIPRDALFADGVSESSSGPFAVPAVLVQPASKKDLSPSRRASSASSSRIVSPETTKPPTTNISPGRPGRHSRSLSNTPLLSRFRDNDKKQKQKNALSDHNLPALATNAPIAHVESGKVAASFGNDGLLHRSSGLSAGSARSGIMSIPEQDSRRSSIVD